MKKICIILVSCLALSFSAFAQDEEEPRKGLDPSRLFFGGNFGMSFGDYTLVNVSPQVGYMINKYLAAGVGLNFIYSSYLYRFVNGDKWYSDQYGNAGLNIFGRVYPIRFLFINVQPEYNYTWGKTKYYDGSPEQKIPSKFVPTLLLGAGAAIPTGARGAFIVMVQYDVIQNVRSPYGRNAFLSIGFNF